MRVAPKNVKILPFVSAPIRIDYSCIIFVNSYDVVNVYFIYGYTSRGQNGTFFRPIKVLIICSYNTHIMVLFVHARVSPTRAQDHIT